MLAYAAFDAAGLPVGSGSVESANKLVIEARLKGAGMHWTRDHADAMVALRAVVPGPDHPLSPVAAPGSAPLPRIAATPSVRTNTIVDGKPTANHPWKQFPVSRSPASAAGPTGS